MEKTTVFVLGNGPSLNDYDLGLLDGLMTIGVNRILSAYDPVVHFWYSPKYTREIMENQETWDDIHGSNDNQFIKEGWVGKSEAIKVVMKESLPGFQGFHTVNKCNQDVPNWSHLIKEKKWMPIEWDGDFDVYDTPGKASGRNATGASAVLWALSLPFTGRIVTLGMTGKPNQTTGITNFYGNNPCHNDKSYDDYERCMNIASMCCSDQGIEIIRNPSNDELEALSLDLPMYDRFEYDEIIWGSAMNHIHSMMKRDE